MVKSEVGDSLGFSLDCTVGYDKNKNTHPLHTHSRSTSYIYNVFQHLVLWLVVIRMQVHQPDLLWVSQSQNHTESVNSLGFSLGLCCRL